MSLEKELKELTEERKCSEPRLVYIVTQIAAWQVRGPLRVLQDAQCVTVHTYCVQGLLAVRHIPFFEPSRLRLVN